MPGFKPRADVWWSQRLAPQKQSDLLHFWILGYCGWGRAPQAPPVHWPPAVAPAFLERMTKTSLIQRTHGEPLRLCVECRRERWLNPGGAPRTGCSSAPSSHLQFGLIRTCQPALGLILSPKTTMPANSLLILVKAPNYKLTAVISGCCEDRDSRIWACSQPPTSLSSEMQFPSYTS